MSGVIFGCPHCGKSFQHSPALEGKTVRCTCGKFFEVRPEPGRPTDQDYALVEDEIPLPPIPNRNAVPAKPNVTTANAFPMPRLTGLDNRQTDELPAWKTLYLPVALLICGVAIWMIGGLVTSTAGDTNAYTIAKTGVMLVANVTVMLLGGALAGSLLGVEFGPLGRVALQFTAMAVFASAIAIVVAQLDKSHSMTGHIVGWHLVILIYWTCFSIFFELDLQEIVMSVAVIAVLQATLMCIMLNAV